MNISLSQESDVPLRQQLSEQIVFLITTGELRAGEEMPSVRALARRANVHHNTVSKAYQELVRRQWLTRKPGSRLIVRTPANQDQQLDPGLDELINETIRRARSLGHSLQTLRNRVRERLLAEPADHLLVVEREAGLREIIQCELEEALGWRVECCSTIELLREPGLAIGAQVLAPSHIAGDLGAVIPAHRPCFPLQYSSAAEQLSVIRALGMPSTIAVASVSESLLKTARSLLAPSIGREHTYQDHLLTDQEVDMRGADLVFCDSIALSLVSCKRKMRYQLTSADCIKEISTVLAPDI
ncbi:MAG: GntR family transcriptional regulator [Acidobacteriaceae bacterium]